MGFASHGTAGQAAALMPPEWWSPQAAWSPRSSRSTIYPCCSMNRSAAGIAGASSTPTATSISCPKHGTARFGMQRAATHHSSHDTTAASATSFPSTMRRSARNCFPPSSFPSMSRWSTRSVCRCLGRPSFSLCSTWHSEKTKSRYCRVLRALAEQRIHTKHTDHTQTTRA